MGGWEDGEASARRREWEYEGFKEEKRSQWQQGKPCIFLFFDFLSFGEAGVRVFAFRWPATAQSGRDRGKNGVNSCF